MMKLLSWLFGGKSTDEQRSHMPQLPPPQGPAGPVSPANFIEIPSRKFHGECVRSGSTCYTLAWSAGDDTGSPGEDCRTGHGRYYLMKGDRVIAEGAMAWPNDGKVADNGTFILNDWGHGDGLKGTFRAFNSLGQKLVVRHFRANLFNNGISPDGRFAACQAFNAPDSSDSGAPACLI